MPRKKSAPKVDPSEQYIRECCTDLEGVFDQEAVRILCTAGIFAVDDPSQIGEAVDRLRGGNDDELEKGVALEERIKTASTTDARRQALNDHDELTGKILTESIDAAYMLGIAVGRRLGSGSLRLPGGAR